MNPFRLPKLEPHRASMETCVYCPKLCRATCPVSNAEGSETLTPWGKMSLSYFAARGDVPVDEPHAEPAWGCTGCHACRERCDFKNEVAHVLTTSRSELFARGAAPEGAKAVATRWAAKSARAAKEASELEEEIFGSAQPKDATALLVGCSYTKHAPDVAKDAVRATRELLGKPVRLVRQCCGLPLMHAGDAEGFKAAALSLAREVAEAPELVVVDPGCARALLVEYPRIGVELARPGPAKKPRRGDVEEGAPYPELFLDRAARALDRLKPLPREAANTEGEPAPAASFRYHDPCQLGRGLGRYDEPRAILAKITGQAPEHFIRTREHGECSGAGGILPVTRPEASETIADTRIGEHRALGGGTLVTACAQSLHRFRTRGEPAEDLVSLIARALR